MQKKTIFLVTMAAILLFAVPVSAANTSVSTYEVHAEPYTPFPVFLVTFGVGFACLFMSLVLSADQNNDAFAALSIIPLFAAAWMANQLDFPVAGLLGSTESNLFVANHHIYPATILTVVIFTFAIIAVFQLYRLLTAPGNVEEPSHQWQGADGNTYGDDE